MKIKESAENYLETILILQRRKGEVRSIDIATELDYSKPSVSIAMKNLVFWFMLQNTESAIILNEVVVD